MIRPIQPKAGEILEVISESPCIAYRAVEWNGGRTALKFEYENGAVLYVGLPTGVRAGRTIDVSISAGPSG